MAVFVLVHGGWHGSWCWKHVRALLRADGHEVFTPTLTGLGERSHLLCRDICLATHIDDVANLLRWEELTDVVLCGHSYAGLIITGVAEAVPDRIRTLVYLDAAVVESGESFYAIFPPEVAAMQRAQAATAGDGWRVPPIPAALGLVGGGDVAWVDRQCTPHPLATLEEPIHYTARATSIGDTRFIMSTDWPRNGEGGLQSPWIPAVERARRRGWPVAGLKTHHDAMLDDPAGLAALLTSAPSTPPWR